MSYEHCDQHDQDATNGCPECEAVGSGAAVGGNAIDEYQRDAGLTATNIPNRQTEILVRCLKLASEAGELADVVGSAFEGSSACDLASMRARVEGELGDALWYVARIATLFDLKLSDVTAKNLAKVKARATGGYWQPTYCEFCGHQVFDPRLAECPFCGAK